MREVWFPVTMASAQLEMSLAWTQFRSVPNRTVDHLNTFLMVLIKGAGADHPQVLKDEPVGKETGLAEQRTLPGTQG